MRKSVYIETSIISYLAARLSRDVRAAAWQQLSAQWWENARHSFELFTSELVFIEASHGDVDAATRRLVYLEGIFVLKVDDEARILAERFIRDGAMPAIAKADALHVAIAATHNMDYLLTWNCRHINNAVLRPLLRSVCAIVGCPCPEICTPLELLAEEVDDVSR